MGLGVANMGLNAIIQFSLPVLLILYPITIAIVLLVMLNKLITLSKLGMQISIFLVTLVSVTSVLGEQLNISILSEIIHHLPFATLSLPWLVPGLIGLGLAMVLPNRIKG